MDFRFLICFYFMGFYLSEARTDQEIKAWFFREGIECNKEFPITPEEMMMLKDNKFPNSKNAKCLVACIFKKTGMLDSKGMFDVESSIAITAKDHADNPQKQESTKKFMETCKTVNDQAVTDGEQGCDRALLLYNCFHETAPKLGILLP